jgi:hypothetical protein
MFNQCQYCANSTLLAYQDESNNIVIANYTAAGGWKTETLGVKAMNGTGLAMQPFTRSGATDQINLFRQTDDGVLGLSSWKSSKHPSISFQKRRKQNTNHYVGSGWSLSEQTYRKIPDGSDLAVSSFGNSTGTGYVDYIQLLSNNYGALNMDTWSGAKNDWLQQNYAPAAMSIETGPGTTVNFTTVSVDALGSAYAVGTAGAGLGYTLYTFDSADNGVSWVKNGTITNIMWT